MVNLNQIPRKGKLGTIIRSCFIPRDDNYVIVGGDYSNMELRIIAELSEEPLWINTFKEGKDLHSILCSETFDIDISRVNEPYPHNPSITYRYLQKTIDFGLSYGMTEYKLSNTASISVDLAKEIIKKFFSKVPKVEAFLKERGLFGQTYGYIRTPKPFRRIRQFPKWNYIQDNPNTPSKNKWLGSINRASMNSPIQGANADIIKQAMIYIQDEIDDNEWNAGIILQIYDELQTECLKSEAELWKAKLQELMIKAGQIILKKVPVVVDVKISNCWSK